MGIRVGKRDGSAVALTQELRTKCLLTYQGLRCVGLLGVREGKRRGGEMPSDSHPGECVRCVCCGEGGKMLPG